MWELEFCGWWLGIMIWEGEMNSRCSFGQSFDCTLKSSFFPPTTNHQPPTTNHQPPTLFPWNPRLGHLANVQHIIQGRRLSRGPRVAIEQKAFGRVVL